MSTDVMRYRGYTAVIRYSAEDKCLFGEVVGIKHIIGFHGNSVEKMESEFKTSIDTYTVYAPGMVLEKPQATRRKPGAHKNPSR
jgi:predicted HicB family RNase H-like nuclease